MTLGKSTSEDTMFWPRPGRSHQATWFRASVKLVAIAIVSGLAPNSAAAPWRASSRMPISVSSSIPVVPACASSSSNSCAGVTTEAGTRPAEAVLR